jgi:4-aminobutyrate aminotransferase/(S)-3-amino-2-methylpropionate transaminase
MTGSDRELWRKLITAEAPTSLTPELYLPGRRADLAREATPIWSHARGSAIWDTRGRRYLDFVAGFGVASIGHAHPRVVSAVRKQSSRLLHGFGDVHPHELRALLAERLARLGPGRRSQVLWAQSGSEAIELALKTAYLATGRAGVLAFHGGFHGQSLGALDVAGWPRFRRTFRPLLPSRTVWAPYAYCTRCELGLRLPSCRFACVGEAFARAEARRSESSRVGAVLIEPILGRGGEVVPPDGYLERIARETRRRGWVLILDEIYTGLGRTGRRFAYQHDGITPDLVCVGKALGGGLPLAAVLGRREILQAWSGVDTAGEARHSATFLAHPLACAAALAALEVMDRNRLAIRARRLGKTLLSGLRGCGSGVPRILEVRGRGLLAGVEFVRDGRHPDPALARTVTEKALAEGLLVLPGGLHGNVVGFSPPLTLSERDLAIGIRRFERALSRALADNDCS